MLSTICGRQSIRKGKLCLQPQERWTVKPQVTTQCEKCCDGGHQGISPSLGDLHSSRKEREKQGWLQVFFNVFKWKVPFGWLLIPLWGPSTSAVRIEGRKLKKGSKGAGIWGHIALYWTQKSLRCSTWIQSEKRWNDLCSFPRQTIQYHSNPSLCLTSNAEEAGVEQFYEDLQG